MENYRLAYEYEEQMEHRKWMKEIPYIQFPADWKIQITPPFRCDMSDTESLLNAITHPFSVRAV